MDGDAGIEPHSKPAVFIHISARSSDSPAVTRRPGTKVATKATATRKSGIEMNATGSRVPSPNIMLRPLTRRYTEPAPMVAPTRTGRMASQNTGRMTLVPWRAQSHTNADVTYGSAYAIRHHPIHSNRAEQKGQCAQRQPELLN